MEPALKGLGSADAIEFFDAFFSVKSGIWLQQF